MRVAVALLLLIAACSGDPAAGNASDAGAGDGGSGVADAGEQIPAPPTAKAVSPQDAAFGSAFSATLEATGGAAPMYWEVLDGDLPIGLTFHQSGVIDGIPIQAGEFTLRARVTDALGRSDLLTFTVTVTPDVVTTISPQALPAAVVGHAYDVAITSTPEGATFVLLDGFLPPGMELTTAGRLHGTPAEEGEWRFVVNATQEGIYVEDSEFVISVHASPFREQLFPDGTAGEAYEVSVSLVNPSPFYELRVASGSLPPGLELDPALGVIQGTPTAAGVFPFDLEATQRGASANVSGASFAIAIFAPLAWEPTTLETAVRFTAYSGQLRASGGSGRFAFELAEGALPEGLRLDASGRISGVPQVTGDFAFTVRVRDERRADVFLDKPFALGVRAILVTTASLPVSYVGRPYDVTLTAIGAGGTFTWSTTGLSSTGLTLEPSGRLHGTPTGVARLTLVIVATDTQTPSITGARSLVLEVLDRIDITTTTIPGGVKGLPYRFVLAAAGGSGSYTWTVASGALPSGILLTPGGVLEGTALSTGPSTFSIRAVDAADASKSATASYAMSIGLPVKGDLNADGIPDLVVSALFHNNRTTGSLGLVYVFFGGSGLAGSLAASQASATIESDDPLTCTFGESLAVGDVTGDGIADLVVGDRGACRGRPGRVHVFAGGIGFGSRLASAAHAVVVGAGDGEFGTSVALGDVTGDGRADLVVGAPACWRAAAQPGKAYVFDGSTLSGTVPLSSAKAAFAGLGNSDCFGTAVEAGPDLTGDGVGDLAIGASAAKASRVGRTVVLAGGSGLSSSSVPVVDIVGEAASDFGGALALGDVTADGKVDLVVGAQHYANYTGRVYVFPGGGAFPSVASGATFKITGDVSASASSSSFGYAVAVADFNGDGAGDLAASDMYFCNASLCPGRVLFYSGRTMASSAAGAATAVSGGSSDNEGYGQALGVADVTGDGVPDLLVGSQDSAPAGRLEVLDHFASSRATITGASPNDWFGFAIP